MVLMINLHNILRILVRLMNMEASYTDIGGTKTLKLKCKRRKWHLILDDRFSFMPSLQRTQ